MQNYKRFICGTIFSFFNSFELILCILWVSIDILGVYRRFIFIYDCFLNVFCKTIKNLYPTFLRYFGLFLLYFRLFWLILTYFCVFFEYFVRICENMHKYSPDSHYVFKNHLHSLKSPKIEYGAVRTFYTAHIEQRTILGRLWLRGFVLKRT